MKPSTTNVNVDPLRPVDEKLLHSFRNWLVGTIGNKYPKDVFTGLCGVACGDCGMYVIEHIEHKLLDLPFDGVHDQHMSLFRQRWAVDLFYQNLA
ncbi:hypothetical protein G4B88_029476 [Cannabis sativa]|uniref:Ubiquitin-like protease family profile domain-containing protein n=1 Tax=Cannabis sativa TaxID=3483 RepID=A0A7J6FI33_CANSA|nr:hypothetical protein G4B88_029476 [Cannabis sativa]